MSGFRCIMFDIRLDERGKRPAGKNRQGSFALKGRETIRTASKGAVLWPECVTYVTTSLTGERLPPRFLRLGEQLGCLRLADEGDASGADVGQLSAAEAVGSKLLVDCVDDG